eukprot:1147581-Pelagomonas_calceolata.AAC.3
MEVASSLTCDTTNDRDPIALNSKSCCVTLKSSVKASHIALYADLYGAALNWVLKDTIAKRTEGSTSWALGAIKLSTFQCLGVVYQTSNCPTCTGNPLPHVTSNACKAHDFAAGPGGWLAVVEQAGDLLSPSSDNAYSKFMYCTLLIHLAAGLGDWLSSLQGGWGPSAAGAGAAPNASVASSTAAHPRHAQDVRLALARFAARVHAHEVQHAFGQCVLLVDWRNSTPIARCAPRRGPPSVSGPAGAFRNHQEEVLQTSFEYVLNHQMAERGSSLFPSQTKRVSIILPHCPPPPRLFELHGL